MEDRATTLCPVHPGGEKKMVSTNPIHPTSPVRDISQAGTIVDSFLPWGSGKGGATANPSRRCRSDESDAWPRGRTLFLRGRSPTCSSPGARVIPVPAPGPPGC